MKRVLLIAGAALALLLAAAGGCAVINAAGVGATQRTLAAHADFLASHIDIRLPETAAGPVPAAVMFHGCGGLRRVQEDYAQAVLAAGYAVVIVDSLSPRGIGRFGAMTQVCTAVRLWGQERAADVFAAIALTRAEPGIDPDRLLLAGWSHGGWTLLDALSYAGEGRLPPALGGGEDGGLPGVRAVMLVYPYCGFPVRSSGRDLRASPRIEAILAGNDLIAPNRDCARLLQRARDAGADASWAIWPGVTHAFDEAEQPPDPRMDYDPEAAAQAHAAFVAAMDALAAQPQ